MQRRIWSVEEIEALGVALALGMTIEQRQGMARLLLAMGMAPGLVARVCRLVATTDAQGMEVLSWPTR
jgi:hypothetical protein